MAGCESARLTRGLVSGGGFFGSHVAQQVATYRIDARFDAAVPETFDYSTHLLGHLVRHVGVVWRREVDAFILDGQRKNAVRWERVTVHNRFDHLVDAVIDPLQRAADEHIRAGSLASAK